MARLTNRKKRENRGDGWQAEKSAMTRTAVLEAAIECFIELGYANTTTAKIADYAGISRGAMMHHFPTRLDVLQATVEYIHAKRLEEYRELMGNIDMPGGKLTREMIAQSVDAAWKYVNLPTFIAYQELLIASRTDPDLNAILKPVERDFEQQFLRTVRQIFPHWAELAGDTVELANDLVHFLLGGMASSHMATNKQARAKRMLAYLTDQLEQIYLGAATAEKSA